VVVVVVVVVVMVMAWRVGHCCVAFLFSFFLWCVGYPLSLALAWVYMRLRRRASFDLLIVILE